MNLMPGFCFESIPLENSKLDNANTYTHLQAAGIPDSCTLLCLQEYVTKERKEVRESVPQYDRHELATRPSCAKKTKGGIITQTRVSWPTSNLQPALVLRVVVATSLHP
jgi:hypothetical protein